MLLIALATAGSQSLEAQNPGGAPASGLVAHDETRIGSFIVVRWTAPDETVPDAFIKNHWYEHVTILKQGKPVLKLTTTEGIRYRIDENSGTDINGDGIPDLIIEEYTGGAHCCSSTVIYAVTGLAKPYFKVDTEHCSGRLKDLDHDGRMEFITCDASFAYAYCPYADSPRPDVVYRYDLKQRTYVPDTPRFARYLTDIVSEIQGAETEMRKPVEDRAFGACAVLQPVLDMIYRTGKFDAGLELFRRLYGNDDDFAEIQKSLIETIRASKHFAAR